MYIDKNKADFNIICEKVAQFAKSGKARKILLLTTPINDYKKVLHNLDIIKEIMRFYEEIGRASCRERV